MTEPMNEPATKHDLGLVKSDLKTEFGGLRNDFGALRTEFAEFRTEIRELIRPIVVTLAHHTAELADIRGHLKDKMVTRDEFHSRMDRFTGRVEDFDYLAAKNRERLDDHARRIKALEDKAPQPPSAEA